MSKTLRRNGTYKVAGTTSDGVRILEPATKPTHFTSKQMRATIANVRLRAETGRFDQSDRQSPRDANYKRR
jgi:hypothetical protein